MEVTRELRTDRISKKHGTANIRMSFCWDNLRLRISTGESCRPADWNAKTGRVKDKPGTYADAINQVLARWEQAGQDVHREARQNGERFTLARMDAAVRARYHQLLAEARGIPVAELPAPVRRHVSLLEHMDEWCTFMEGRVSMRTRKPLSKTYLRRLRHLREELGRFSESQKYSLSFQSMNWDFFHKFQHYQLTVLDNEPNTFAGYIKNIKAFLTWCEKLELPVSPKFHDWEAVESYVGADFLTADELRRWADVDLSTPQVLAYVQQHFPLHTRTQGRRNLTHADHLQRLVHARDKFLLCAYTGLRISDADRLAPEHIHGELIRIEAGKNVVVCLIPFIDDDILKPVQLVQQYAGRAATCLPLEHDMDEYLPHVAHLAGVTRLHVTSRIGRKTFVTTRIYQGVARNQVMVATGHQTEKSFMRYLGTNEKELIEAYRRASKTSR